MGAVASWFSRITEARSEPASRVQPSFGYPAAHRSESTDSELTELLLDGPRSGEQADQPNAVIVHKPPPECPVAHIASYVPAPPPPPLAHHQVSRKPTVASVASPAGSQKPGVHFAAYTASTASSASAPEAEDAEADAEEPLSSRLSAQGMHTYQRYSREQPEKDTSACASAMRDWSHANHAPSKPRQVAHYNNRHYSDPYVGQWASPSRRCGAALHSKSTTLHDKPLHQGAPPPPLPRHSSLTCAPNPQIKQQQHQQQQQQHLQRLRPPQRVYQPKGNPSGPYDPDRPHIPLPPPIQRLGNPQSAVGKHTHYPPADEGDMYSRSAPGRGHGNQSAGKSRHSDHDHDHHHHQQQQQQQQLKAAYPYEEPTSVSEECSGGGGSVLGSGRGSGGGGGPEPGDCASCNQRFDHCPMHQVCRCQCMCMPSSDEPNYCGPPQQQQQAPPPLDERDDRMSDDYSDSSNSEYMNLAYQRTGDYPELMDELENTLSYRNRMRVQKTMQRFEMLSRQNKNLEKPIFEDEESMASQYQQQQQQQQQQHQQPPPPHPHHHHHHHHQQQQQQQQAQFKHGPEVHQHECPCGRCSSGGKIRRDGGGARAPRNEGNLPKQRSSYPPTQFPRNTGYVERVARDMDPVLNGRHGYKSKEDGRGHEAAGNGHSRGGSWQLDQRRNEWVKVNPHHHAPHYAANEYDFENTYPPLPSRPTSESMYDRRNYMVERPPPAMCGCHKCRRPH